jgi:Tol biopolymer transport system component
VDGKRLFVVGEQSRGELMRYDSASRQFVTFLSGISAEGLDFSRDGKWVAYVTFPDGVLWRSRADGSERLQLTNSPRNAALPRWSPDGKHIAFSGLTPGKNWNIFLISADGGSPEKLTPSENSELDPNWSADGQSLVFGEFGGGSHHLDLYSEFADTPGFNASWEQGTVLSQMVTRRPLHQRYFPRWVQDVPLRFENSDVERTRQWPWL